MKRFLTVLRAGILLSAIAATASAHAVAGNVVAFDPLGGEALSEMTGAYYMRATLAPRVDDLALIQRRPALYLASFNDGMAMVAYSLENRRIVYRVIDGAIGEGVRAEIDRAVARLQRRIT